MYLIKEQFWDPILVVTVMLNFCALMIYTFNVQMMYTFKSNTLKPEKKVLFQWYCTFEACVFCPHSDLTDFIEMTIAVGCLTAICKGDPDLELGSLSWSSKPRDQPTDWEKISTPGLMEQGYF